MCFVILYSDCPEPRVNSPGDVTVRVYSLPWSSMLWLELDPVFAIALSAPYAILFCFLSRIRFYFLALLPFSSYFVCHALHCSPVLPSPNVPF
jgi:hypothetical protein